jgi:hypothetical protein
MSQRPSCFWAGVLLACLSPVLSIAQEKSVAPITLDKDAGFAAIAFRGLDQLLSDINYITTSAENAQSGMMLGALMTPFTEGIDRSRPFGLIANMVEQSPVPVLALPVKDLSRFLKGLEAFTGPPDVDKDGTIMITVGPRLLFVKDREGWAYAALEKNALEKLPKDPMKVFGPLTEKHTFSANLNLQAIPKPLRDMMMNQMEMAFEQGMQMQGGPAPNVEAVKAQMAIMKQMADQVETINLGLVVDPNQREVGIDVLSRVVEGSELAKMSDEMQIAQTRHAYFAQPDATMSVHSSLKFGPLTKKQQLEAMGLVPLQIKGLLDAAERDQKLPPDARQFIDGLVQDIIELHKESINKGYTDMGMVVQLESGAVGVAGALSPANPDKVKQLMGKISGMANGKQGIVVSLNASDFSGVKFHTVKIPIPSHEEEARKVLGNELQFLIGTGADATYFGFGSDGEKKVKLAIAAAASGAKMLGPPAMRMQISVLSILQFAQAIAPNPVAELVMSKLQEHPETSKVTVTNELIPRGSIVHIRLGEGLLHAIGTASQMARNQPRF